MVAHFLILLPQPFFLKADVEYVSVSTTTDGIDYVIHSPVQSELRSEAKGGPVGIILSKVVPAANPGIDQDMTIDGQAVVACDLVRVDAHAPEFDRSSGFDVKADPVVGHVFELVNRWLILYRTITGATMVRAVSTDSATWRVIYRADDGTELAVSEGSVRGRGMVRVEVAGRSTLTPEFWRDLWSAIPDDYEVARWDELRVDAAELLPNIGAALVLAYTALEIRIDDAIEVLAGSSITDRQVWNWFVRKRPLAMLPSTEDKAKALFRIFTGSSMADSDEVWRTFTRLRKARNAFAHGGVARNEQGQALTVADAAALVAESRSVQDWLESHLPPTRRRPTLEQKAEISITAQLFQV